MHDELLDAIRAHINQHPGDARAYLDAVTLMHQRICDGHEHYHRINREFRETYLTCNAYYMNTAESMRLYERAYKASLYTDCRVDFDAYMQYLEWNRDPSRRFWLPRRNTLYNVARKLQGLEHDEVDLVTISLPPGVGKTTLAIFFLTWTAGLHPDNSILTVSHSNDIVTGMFEEVLRIVHSDEYLFNSVFPDSRLAYKNAERLRIDLHYPKRFQTFQFTSIGAGNAGKLRASNLLYCDDLVDGIETAMSKERMDKLWNIYTADLRQRKIGDCRELHIATRWTIWDPIGRIQAKQEESPEGKKVFISIPAMNENDESNFNYGNGVGFTTEFYREQRDTMEECDWEALYMNQPIERKGQLYNSDELRRYLSLPAGDPDAILGVCDTKDKGSDYAFLPVFYVYGNDHYLVDCVCDNGKPEVVDERLVQILLDMKVQNCQFESNSAGGRVAEKVDSKLKEKGGITAITTRFTTANKETKIIVNSPWVKQHVLFRDPSMYKRNSDYGRMISMLTTYTMQGKNAHDDVPDGMSMYALYYQNLQDYMVEAVRRPC